MRHARRVFAVVSCLAAVLTDASAKADIFNFVFGSRKCDQCAFGTFTTGAAAPDPGFELITGLTFNVLLGIDGRGNPFRFINVAGENFEPGAAFNPTTDAFHSGRAFPNSIGIFQVAVPEGPKLFIDPPSFAQGSEFLFGRFVLGDGRQVITVNIDGALAITPERAPAPVPEASTWAMLLLGFGGLGLAVRRRRLGAVYLGRLSR